MLSEMRSARTMRTLRDFETRRIHSRIPWRALTRCQSVRGCEVVASRNATPCVAQLGLKPDRPECAEGTLVLKFTHPVIDIAIVCSNFDESLHFYRDLLGLQVHADLQIPREVAVGANLAPDGFRHVRLRAGETLIKLMEIADPPAPRSDSFQSGVRWLTFFITDLEATVEQLKARGVEFHTEPVSAPDAAHVVCAKAPDGMLVELVQIEDDLDDV